MIWVNWEKIFQQNFSNSSFEGLSLPLQTSFFNILLCWFECNIRFCYWHLDYWWSPHNLNMIGSDTSRGHGTYSSCWTNSTYFWCLILCVLCDIWRDVVRWPMFCYVQHRAAPGSHFIRFLSRNNNVHISFAACCWSRASVIVARPYNNITEVILHHMCPDK